MPQLISKFVSKGAVQHQRLVGQEQGPPERDGRGAAGDLQGSPGQHTLRRSERW